MPQAVEYFRSATLARVVCGSRTTVALDTEGKVFAWGKGEDGTLGIGERSTALKPRLVEGLLRQPIAQMTCRGAHVLALTERGQLWAWGRNEDGQLGTRSGSERPRELTHGETPERVRGLMGILVRHVACGRCHSMAVDADGRLHSWGGGEDGALGHGDTVSRASPAVVAAFAGRRVDAIACGSRHTLALAEGAIFSWGWGAYGQLGHGDVGGRLAPTEIEALAGAPLGSSPIAAAGSRASASVAAGGGPQLACGYRHSMIVCSPAADGGGEGEGGTARDVYAWGWGRHGQLGTGAYADELSPVPVSRLRSLGVWKLRLGGRHSLALCFDGRVYAWGNDDMGQLGLGAQGARPVPTLIESLTRASSLSLRVLDASCGWSYSALLVSVSDPHARALDTPKVRRDSSSGREQLKRRLPRLLVWSDFEGLFGQILGTSIQFMLMEKLLKASCGFSQAMLIDELLPGAAAVYLCGHAFFAAQGALLSQRTRSPVTALPQGINIVTFFAFSQLIMAPTYASALRDGAEVDVAARAAYDAGLCACVLLALLELVGVLFVETLRTNIPRAAMLAAIAGVSLTYIAMGFSLQIFAAPGTAMVSMLLMLLFYGGQVKLPFKIPGGVLAVAVGWCISVISGELGYKWFSPAPLALDKFLPTIALPTPNFGFLATFMQPSFWHCLSVVVPMWLVTLVNNLANIEAAAAVGDHYSPRVCLLGCALIDLSCAFLGNPFPTCIYIGHAAFKAMGCRVGYLYLNMVPTVYFGCMRGAGLLQQILPIESGVGFLLWVGLQITAQGFEGDNTPEGWRHGPAVALGLIPSMSAWTWQTVATTYEATRGLLCDAMAPAVRANTTACGMELHELMQEPSEPMAPADTPIGAFQIDCQSLFLSGMYALAKGYLLTAIALSSMLVHIIDGKFDKAACWLLLCAAAAGVGIIHNTTLDPLRANPLFPVMYTLAAVALLLCHASQNKAEQIRELQLRLVRRLIALLERFPSTPPPLRRYILHLGRRFGLIRRHSSGDDPDFLGSFRPSFDTSGREEAGDSASGQGENSRRSEPDLPSREGSHRGSMDGALLPSDGSLSNLLQGESSRGGMERTDSEASAGWRSLFVDVPDWIASTVQSPGRAAAPAAEQLSQVTPEKVGAPSRGRSRDRRSSSGESADSKAEPLLSNVQPV